MPVSTVSHVPEAADQQRGGGQQDERDGDLDDDERVADARAAAWPWHAAPADFQPFDDVRARRDCSAGASPTRSPAASEVASANRKTR